MVLFARKKTNVVYGHYIPQFVFIFGQEDFLTLNNSFT